MTGVATRFAAEVDAERECHLPRWLAPLDHFESVRIAGLLHQAATAVERDRNHLLAGIALHRRRPDRGLADTDGGFARLADDRSRAIHSGAGSNW